MSRTRIRGWLRPLNTVAAPVARVVCFPHSGGSATAFLDWPAAMPPGVELVAVQYPGRGDRFVEPPVDDVSAMARHVAADLAQLPFVDHVLFGHSLGAVVAYETAVMLRSQGREPSRLCASACLPPGDMAKRQIHLAPDDEFWAVLCELGGIEAGIAENAGLREVLLPTLRSDLRAHAVYQPRPGTPPLSCSVRAYHGTGDPLVEEGRMAAWAGVTSGPFTLMTRPGGHFHLSTGVAELVSDILARDPV